MLVKNLLDVEYKTSTEINNFTVVYLKILIITETTDKLQINFSKLLDLFLRVLLEKFECVNVKMFY